jgi:gamma-glutamylaminecyclotransferase
MNPDMKPSSQSLVARIFVYGTLKTGFPNFHVNTGTRLPGAFVTVSRFPLYLIGPTKVPWLVNRPGEGECVVGEVFEVDAATLARMDVLEQIDEPLWYAREPLLVHALDDPVARPMQVQVYFGSAERLATDTIHAGPLAVYTAEHARGYSPENA